MNLPILIRDEVWKYLKSIDLRLGKEVQQCIKKVEKGQFDFGLRVKKLKGVSQRVWEARINQTSRLLFTYRSFNSSDGQIQTYRAIESICVEHDDVSHQAKIIGRNWERLEIVEISGNLDLDFDRLNDEEQEKINLWETEEIKIQSELKNEVLENIKWLILEPKIIKSEEEWQNAVKSGADLRLLLTPKESELISTDGNILLSGSAGTGKTTVGLYRLARTLETNPTDMCLYVAYNPILVKESEEQFKQLWGNSYESLSLKPSFLTIRDLCLKIAKDFGKEFDRHIVDYPQFYQRYIKKPESRVYPPSLIWDEIRSVIKGANLKEQPQSYLMSENEYESLGRKRSDLIQRKDRRIIYKLAQWYQEYLNREQLADEIDLTRSALQITKIENHNPYALIVCDEVQDFTEIQLEFLIGLIVQGGQIFCAGDINQMISPSGFRWGDLTTRLYQKNRKWTKENLSTNFRSTGKLGSLAIKILNLKFKLFPESQPSQEVSQSTTGELARLVEASSDKLKQINLGAADAILVRNEKRKQELNEALGTALIFTIEGSKGLEFDTIYLIDFFENSKSLWADALNSSKKLKEHQKPSLRLEFNLLYVAITRARRLLNICEAERPDLWKRSELAECLIPMSIDEAFNQAQSIDPQDWYERAIYYQGARLFAQALECATKSEDETLCREIEIELLLIDRKYGEAAQLLLKIGKYPEAAENFAKIEAWERSADCWRLADNLHEADKCRNLILENIDVHKTSLENIDTHNKIVAKGEICNFSSKVSDADVEIFINRLVSNKTSKTDAKEIKIINNKIDLKKAEIEYKKGMIEFKNDNKSQAIYCFSQTIKANPSHAKAYHQRGILKAILGDKKGAVVDLDQALYLDPACAEFYHEQAILKVNMRDKEGALSSINKAIQINPTCADFYRSRGIVNLALGDKEGALSDLNQAIQINLTCSELYHERSTIKSELRDKEGALSDLNQAIQMNPTCSELYYKRSTIKSELRNEKGAIRDKEGAIADLNLAIQLNPTCAKYYYFRGFIKSELFYDFNETHDFSQAIKLNSKYYESYYERGIINLKMGNMKEATYDFSQVIKLKPDCAAAYYQQGIAKSRLGNKKEAIADFDQAVQICEFNEDIYRHRGAIKLDMGDKQGAISDMSKAVEVLGHKGRTDSNLIRLIENLKNENIDCKDIDDQ